jgi:hypothetical protein
VQVPTPCYFLRCTFFSATVGQSALLVSSAR